MEWKNEEDERLEEFLTTYPSVTVIEQEIPTVRMAIVVQGKVMYDGPNPMGIDSYPFVPVLAYYAPQMPYFPWRIQGVVRKIAADVKSFLIDLEALWGDRAQAAL
jgi:hypothetical protein